MSRHSRTTPTSPTDAASATPSPTAWLHAIRDQGLLVGSGGFVMSPRFKRRSNRPVRPFSHSTLIFGDEPKTDRYPTEHGPATHARTQHAQSSLSAQRAAGAGRGRTVVPPTKHARRLGNCVPERRVLAVGGLATCWGADTRAHWPKVDTIGAELDHNGFVPLSTAQQERRSAALAAGRVDIGPLANKDLRDKLVPVLARHDQRRPHATTHRVDESTIL